MNALEGWSVAIITGSEVGVARLSGSLPQVDKEIFKKQIGFAAKV